MQSLLSSGDARYEVIPSLEELLNPEIVDPHPWNKTFDEVAHQPFIVLHTSGSTGMPKPVDISHGLIATNDAQQQLPDVDGRCVTARCWANQSVFTALPPFHSAGFNFFSFSIFQSTQLVLGPYDQPPSLSTVETILDMKAADAAVMPPSLLAEVAGDEKVLKKVSRWSSVTFGGGPLPKPAGDGLWAHTKVLQILGSIETFNLPELVPAEIDEWEYHRYYPSLGIDFREALHELVFVRNKETVRHQGTFWTFPDQDEYHMKDMYERHPAKPDLWRYRGRLDDIIVLSNGEKFNPTETERIIAQDPLVSSALMVGTSREQPAVLIEPAETSDVDAQGRRASIVQVVERANGTLPAHAQIHDSHIRVVESPTTFLRSSKGEVQRAPTVDVLPELISNVYEEAEAKTDCSMRLDFSSREKLGDSLNTALSTVFFQGKHIAETDSVFDRGLDSLQAVKLMRFIKTSVREQTADLDINLAPRFIYQNPTVSMMTEALLRAKDGSSSKNYSDEESLDDMQKMPDEFSSRINHMHKAKEDTSSSGKTVVVLTGSTGSRGSYLLDGLIRNPSVDEVVCLNRAGGNADKQSKVNEPRGLSQNFSKVEFLEVDLTKPDLNLEEQEYAELVGRASHIIHNAWPVNFNLILASFKPQLETCCNLLQLSVSSPRKMHLLFLSSVGAAKNWAKFHDGPVPEVKLDDFRVPEPIGYAQTKQLAELLFAHASERHDVQMTICRLGQIAGPVKSKKGMWSPSEWFPSLFLSCEALGKVPQDLGPMDCMDWIPVDLLSDMLVEAICLGGIDSVCGTEHKRSQGTDIDTRRWASDTPGASASSSPGLDPMSSQTSLSSAADSELSSNHALFLHFVNPHRTKWSDIASFVTEGEENAMQPVPFADWVNAVANLAETKEDNVEAIPAVKLLDFFADLAQSNTKPLEFLTAATQERSVSLRTLSPVSVDWLRLWMHQWRSNRS